MAILEQLWTCELCGNKYSSEATALDCEKRHLVPTEITPIAAGKYKYDKQSSTAGSPTYNTTPYTIAVLAKSTVDPDAIPAETPVERVVYYQRVSSTNYMYTQAELFPETI